MSNGKQGPNTIELPNVPVLERTAAVIETMQIHEHRYKRGTKKIGVQIKQSLKDIKISNTLQKEKRC